jgi:dihydrofolate reductase
MVKFKIIAAFSKNNIIGYKNKIPWDIKEDMKLFKEYTINNIVIMGRKTFESMNCDPLKNRINIVLSKDLVDLSDSKNLYIVNDIKSIYGIINKFNHLDVFIIGGSSLYKYFMPLCSEMYISHIKRLYKGDRYFPKIDLDKWESYYIKEYEDFTFKKYRAKINEL